MNTIRSINVKIADKDVEFIERELWARLNKKRISSYLMKNEDDEIKKIGMYLDRNTISVFPYKYTQKYDINKIEIIKDTNGLFYAIYKGKKVYLRRKYKTGFRAKRYFSNILMEQDDESPHRYLTDSFYPHDGDIVLDIGGAEGIFAISYIDRIKKLYIFECDPEWTEALKYTFKDYPDKVCIVEKYVSDINDDHHVSLDRFVMDNDLLKEHLFIKVDAEGSEPLILKGGERVLEEAENICMAICTYHSQSHEKMIRDMFSEWEIEASDGYMLYYYDYNIDEPYLRRGVLRLKKADHAI